jgi:hypothetical protein
MSEIGDDFKVLHDMHREERDAALPGRREELSNLREEGYSVQAFSEHHYRVGNGKQQIDIWPSRNRFAYVIARYLHTGPRERGTIREPQTITEFVHERLPLKARA